MSKPLPPVPAKRYFTIGEVSELCDVRPYVLRYWEQEFSQLKPLKRKGNRRYYQHQEILLIRKIRGLLYDQGFTISGARIKLSGGHVPQEPEVTEPLPSAAPPSFNTKEDVKNELEAILHILDAPLPHHN